MFPSKLDISLLNDVQYFKKTRNYQDRSQIFGAQFKAWSIAPAFSFREVEIECLLKKKLVYFTILK